jgi:hypothetical protein
MKHFSIRFIFYALLFLQGDVFSIEGFAAGTLVKVRNGYAKIENVSIGDYVICYDSDKKFAESRVIYCAKKYTDKYIHLKTSNEYIDVAYDQKFYDIQTNTWLNAESLSYFNTIELIENPIDVYVIGVEKYYNFFVSSSDICAHNFFPPIVLAISLAFGSGACEVIGASLGIAGIGSYLGWQWHKNKRNKFTISPMYFDISQEQNGLYDIDNAQAPGKPTKEDGYTPPKKWDGKKVKNPEDGGYGWPDKKGHIWIPTGPKAHRGPHWDVQDPKTGRHRNILPGGKVC